jgi:iron complex outermembrane receptor protein
MSAHILSRSIRALFAGGVALGAAAAHGQQAGEEDDAATRSQRVEVTGSRIPALDTGGASPITTLGARDIRIDGMRNVEDLLNRLPQVFAGQGQAISNGASGTATVDLRRMGPQRTLVLVNGRRLPSGSVLNAAADLNQIPTQLIRRVDVLTGGAAAVYGSGAVAGVVNIILKDDFTGVELEANLSGAHHRQHNGEVQALVRARGYALPDDHGLDARKHDISLLAGTGFAGNDGNATVFVGRREATALVQGERDFSSCSLGAAAPRMACAGSTTSVARLGNFTPGADGNPRPFADGDAYNFSPPNFLQRPSHETNVNVTLRLDLTPAARLYTDVNFHSYLTRSQIAPGGIFFGQQAGIAYENPLLNDAWRTALGLRRPGDVAQLFVGKRNTEGGPRDTLLQDISLREVLGVKGTAAGWRYDVFGQFARVNHRDEVGGYFSSRRIARALDVVPGANGRPACRAAVSGLDTACVPYDILHPGGITAAALDYVEAAGSDAGYTRQSAFGGNIGTDLGRYGLRLPGTDGGLGVSLGYEQRTEALVFEPDEERRSGDLSGAGGATQPVHGSFKIKETYAEVKLPLLAGVPFARRLALSGAWRRSRYSTGTVTHTFGLGLDWEMAAWLRVRGSAQRAMRGPTIIELYTPGSVLLTGPTSDPCGGATPRATLAQCIRTGLPAALYGKVPANTTSQYNGHSGGNRDLRPETANTYTLGVVVEPARDLTFTLDAFRLNIRDAIQPYNAQVLFNGCVTTGAPAYCKLVDRRLCRSRHHQHRFAGDFRPGRGRQRALAHRRGRGRRRDAERHVDPQFCHRKPARQRQLRLRWPVRRHLRAAAPDLAPQAARDMVGALVDRTVRHLALPGAREKRQARSEPAAGRRACLATRHVSGVAQLPGPERLRAADARMDAGARREQPARQGSAVRLVEFRHQHPRQRQHLSAAVRPLRPGAVRQRDLAVLIGAGRLRVLAQAALAYRGGQALEHVEARFPVDAAVRDRLAVAQFLARDQVLAAADQVRFHHHADDAVVAVRDLLRDVGAHRDLVFRLLAAVGVRRVDHQAARQAVGAQRLAGFFDAGGVVVRRLAAAQDDMAVLVAGSGHDRRVAALRHGQEMVRLRRGLDRVGRDLDVAVGAVLETDRARQAGGQFAVHLRLGGARADRAPADQVGNILRADHVQELGAGRQAQFVDVAQQCARHAQSVVDAEAVVHVRIVDQTLPAHRRARLFEIHAHHDFKLAGEPVTLLEQAARILHRGLRIVDRARADHDHQAVVLAVQDAVQGRARPRCGLFRHGRHREFADQVRGRRQFLHFADAQVVGAGHGILRSEIKKWSC